MRLGALVLILAAACAQVGGEDEADDRGAADDPADDPGDAGPGDDDDPGEEEPDPPVTGGGGCGDYVCGAGEDCATCPDDCFCSREAGNRVCDTGETAVTHPDDCGARSPDGLVPTESVDPRLVQVWGASTKVTLDAATRANLLQGCATNPDDWCFRRFFQRVENDHAYLPDIIAIRELGRGDQRALVIAELMRQLDLLADGDAGTREYAYSTTEAELIAWRSARFSRVGPALQLTERVELTGAFDCGELKLDDAGAVNDDAILIVMLEDGENAGKRIAVANLHLAHEENGGGGYCQAENYARVLYHVKQTWGAVGDLYPEFVVINADTNEKPDMHGGCAGDPACVESWRRELDPSCDATDLRNQNGWYERLHPLLTPSAGCLPRRATMWDTVSLAQRTVEQAGPDGGTPRDNICSHFTLRGLATIGEDLAACTSSNGRIDHTFVRLERADGTRIDDPREARTRIPNAKTDEGSYPSPSATTNDHYADHRAQMTLLRW